MLRRVFTSLCFGIGRIAVCPLATFPFEESHTKLPLEHLCPHLLGILGLTSSRSAVSNPSAIRHHPLRRHHLISLGTYRLEHASIRADEPIFFTTVPADYSCCPFRTQPDTHLPGHDSHQPTPDGALWFGMTLKRFEAFFCLPVIFRLHTRALLKAAASLAV